MALLTYSESCSKRDPVLEKREEGRKDGPLMRFDSGDGPLACVHSHTATVSINTHVEARMADLELEQTQDDRE